MAMQTDVSRQGITIIAAAVILVVGSGYAAYTWMTNQKNSPSNIERVTASGKGVSTQESDHYSEVLGRYNRQNASVAEQQGDSFLSVLSTKTKPPAQQASPPSFPAPTPAPSPSPTPQNQQAEQKQAERLAAQTDAMLKNWLPVAHGPAQIGADGVGYAKTITRDAKSSIQSGERAVRPENAEFNQKIVADFALVPALLETDIDTDENSLVWASVPAGEYAGAEVFAMGYKRLNESVDMTFTFMKWRGRSYKITAKAVDQNSMRTALSGEVNNRWMTRIVIPAFAQGLGRTGQLYEQANSQNIITPQGGVIQTYSASPNGSAVAGTILGGMGAQAGQVLANDAANIPVKQVLIARKTTIGIRFIGPVLESDDVAAGATGPQTSPDMGTLSQPSQQPARFIAVPPTGGPAAGTTFPNQSMLPMQFSQTR